MAKTRDKRIPRQVDTFTHEEASRRNISPAEYQSVMAKEDQSPLRVAYERRNRDLDPQLVWGARTRRIGPISSCLRRRSSSRRRCTPRC